VIATIPTPKTVTTTGRNLLSQVSTKLIQGEAGVHLKCGAILFPKVGHGPLSSTGNLLQRKLTFTETLLNIDPVSDQRLRVTGSDWIAFFVS
jgi:hypothetical protein